MIRHLTGIAIASGVAYSAAAPIATISSAGPVFVSGVEMAASTVAFWPVGSGDLIESGKWGATVILRDRSRINLSAGSRVTIDRSGDIINVHVLSGGIDYSLMSQGSARLYLGENKISNSSTQGSAGKSVSGGGGGRRGGPNGSGSSQPVVPPPSVSPVY